MIVSANAEVSRARSSFKNFGTKVISGFALHPLRTAVANGADTA
jgi:hypothetical protein